MATSGNQLDLINAEPTKTFFVEMITRDIPLEQAILDLVDNSVDGARRFRSDSQKPLDGFFVEIELSQDHFQIRDNCGGFGKEAAKDYAFRFGRPTSRATAPHAIGQFGIGMKRALFKFGNRFSVRSSTGTEHWAVDVDVPQWLSTEGWTFPWAGFPADSKLSEESVGTEVIVRNLRPEVSARFGTSVFRNTVENLIKSKHRQFLSEGLAVLVNGLSAPVQKSA